MLEIQRISTLARAVDFRETDLRLIAEDKCRYFREFTLWGVDPAKRPRDVLSVTGDLRKLHCRLHKLFACHFRPNEFSHGGVKGRHPLSNATRHFRNQFAITLDVSNFYPSLSNWRLNRLLLVTERCSPPVARILTDLCTHEFHLALGLVTSPILADRLMDRIDTRIAVLCDKYRLAYSRYVDDLTISGPFNVGKTGIPDRIREILGSAGLATNDKTKMGRIDEGIEITGIRLNKGRADVGRKYLRELLRLLDDHLSLARGGDFLGPIMTSSQLAGKIYAVTWINPRRKAELMSKFRKIDWSVVYRRAAELNLMKLVKRLTPRGVARPDAREPLGDYEAIKARIARPSLSDSGSSDAPF